MRVLKLMFPVTIGIGLINFNLSVDSIFATLISERGAGRDRQGVPHLHAARRACSRSRSRRCCSRRFSRLAARRDMDGLRAVQGSGTRQMLLLLVPAAALMLVLSEPITRIVYQRGEFDAAQTDLVAEALFYFAFSLPFAGVNLILIRTFFSLQLPWRPTQIALANLGLNAALDALLYKPMGVGGIPLATAIVSLVTTSRWPSRCAGSWAGSTGAHASDAGSGSSLAGGALAPSRSGSARRSTALGQTPARADRARGGGLGGRAWRPTRPS